MAYDANGIIKNGDSDNYDNDDGDDDKYMISILRAVTVTCSSYH